MVCSLLRTLDPENKLSEVLGNKGVFIVKNTVSNVLCKAMAGFI